MFLLAFFLLLIIGGLTFIILRLSISCIFWVSKYREDKMRVVNTYFPYYTISLFTLCSVAIIWIGDSFLVYYYFGFVFFLSLFIWRYEILQGRKSEQFNNKNIEPHHPKLP